MLLRVTVDHLLPFRRHWEDRLTAPEQKIAYCCSYVFEGTVRRYFYDENTDFKTRFYYPKKLVITRIRRDVIYQQVPELSSEPDYASIEALHDRRKINRINRVEKWARAIKIGLISFVAWAAMVALGTAAAGT
ncbi:MAG TPA: hypothetical protein VLG47_00265 [Candidatus Saccharimonadales bacterium]|nr:hypothetical protein [Candidatus Saccharimonadales bacterium]